MQRFWISWIQPTDDYRPLTYPPNAQILGYWRTGESFESGERVGFLLCALVSAISVADAKAAVFKDWPEAFADGDCRFIEQRENDWLPGDRFNLDHDWMKERCA